MSQNDNIAAKANLIVEKYFVDTELEDDKNKIYNDNEDMLFWTLKLIVFYKK